MWYAYRHWQTWVALVCGVILGPAVVGMFVCAAILPSFVIGFLFFKQVEMNMTRPYLRALRRQLEEEAVRDAAIEAEREAAAKEAQAAGDDAESPGPSVETVKGDNAAWPNWREGDTAKADDSSDSGGAPKIKVLRNGWEEFLYSYRDGQFNFSACPGAKWGLIIGGFLGVPLGFVYNPHHFWLVNFVTTGIIGMCVGLMLGLLWQLSSAERRKAIPVIGTVVTGSFMLIALCFVLGLVSFLSWQTAQIDDLRNMPLNSITRITIYDFADTRELCVIEDQQILKEFASACRDITNSLPESRRITSSWLVVVEGSQAYRIEFHTATQYPNQAIGTLVFRSKTSSVYGGEFRSTALRGWLEKHAPAQPPAW